MTNDSTRSFIPAAGHDIFLPLYDPVQWLLGGESVRAELIEGADITAGQRVLDIGCGTGDLLMQLARTHPGVELVGIDPDPKALGRATGKAERAGVALTLDQGFSDDLPYESASFDRVLSSFMFHHLDLEVKKKTLLEAKRMLAPGGSIHLADFGSSQKRPDGLFGRFFHSHAHVQQNFGGGILSLFEEAGFSAPHELSERKTLLGRVASYSGSA